MDSFSIWSIVIAVFYLMGLLSVVNAVMTTRTSQGAIAWIVSLITFPFIAIPAYWVFGNSRFNGYAKARNSNNEAVQKKLTETLNGLEAYTMWNSQRSLQSPWLWRTGRPPLSGP